MRSAAIDGRTVEEGLELNLIESPDEKQKEAVKEGGEQVLALVDLRQVGPQNVDVPFLLWLIMTLRSYFPKRLGQVALVDPPPVLFEAVRLQRPFPRLRAPSGGDGV